MQKNWINGVGQCLGHRPQLLPFPPLEDPGRAQEAVQELAPLLGRGSSEERGGAVAGLRVQAFAPEQGCEAA